MIDGCLEVVIKPSERIKSKKEEVGEISKASASEVVTKGDVTEVVLKPTYRVGME